MHTHTEATNTTLVQRDPRTMTVGSLIGSLALARKDFAVRELLRRYEEDVDGFRSMIDNHDAWVRAPAPAAAPAPSTAALSTPQWYKDQDEWLEAQDNKPPTMEPMGPLMRKIASSGWDMRGMKYPPDRVRAFVENESLYHKSEALLTIGQRRLWRTIKHYYGNFLRFGNFPER